MSNFDKNPIDFFLPKKKSTKGGKGSGNWGHGGLAGVWGGSSPAGSGSSIVYDENAHLNMIDGVAIATDEELTMLENEIFNSWGFSYHPIGKHAPETGYMVSYETPTAVIPIEDYNRSIMKQFILENIDYFRDKPDRYFGGWISEGKIFFDVSKNMQDVEKSALRGINQNQKAIYDLAKGDEIHAISYLDYIREKLWTPELVTKTFKIHQAVQRENKGNFVEKYREKLSKMFGKDFVSTLENERNKEMTEKETNPKDYKHEWTKKPREEWTEQDIKENMHYQETRKPIRFQFGKDATEEDVDKFLDMVFGKEKKKKEE